MFTLLWTRITRAVILRRLLLRVTHHRLAIAAMAYSNGGIRLLSGHVN
jgi:hypothetical protein